jgi:hypothetical protein
MPAPRSSSTPPPPRPAKKIRANPNHKAVATGEAKDRVLELLAKGHSVEMAMGAVDRSASAYRNWRETDPVFAQRVLQVREVNKAAQKRRGEELEVPDFPEFSELYLHQRLPTHHMRVWDLLNERTPRDLHPKMRFQAGRPNYVILNFPPEHAKSTTWTANWTTWRIIRDFSTSGAIISAKQDLAKQFLYQVKQRFEHPDYHELQAAYAPEGGFKGESWREDRFYVAGRRGEGKDPTLQALGIRSKIYGSRLKFIVMDDCVDLSNASEWEQQHRWLGQEVITRLPPEGGLIFIIGTRVAPVDLYMKLREQKETVWVEGEPLERPVYTMLSQPAVLDVPHPDPKSWEVLWPEYQPGTALAQKKGTLSGDAQWALVYQQEDVAEDATFPREAVEAAVDHSRMAGLLTNSGMKNRPTNLWVVAGLDPATVGYTAITVAGLDRQTKKRYILDGYNKSGTTPQQLREKIKEFTLKYRVNTWMVEVNAFQRSLVQDEELRQWLFANGATIKPHMTGANKWDADYGVQAMASLFLSCVEGDEDNGYRRKPGGGLIDLPNPIGCPFVTALKEQLITWQPLASKKGQLTDTVMSLWFTEVEFRRILDASATVPRHAANPFTSRADAQRRRVVDLRAVAEQQAHWRSEGVLRGAA